MMNKRIKLALMTALLTGAITPAVSFAQTGSSNVVATVAGEPITQAELNERVNVNRQIAKQTGNTSVTDAQLISFSRDELINQRLLLNKAKNARISVNQSDVDVALAELAKSNNMNVAQFQQMVNTKGGAGAWDTLLKDVRNELTMKELVDRQVLSKVKEPTAKEITAEVKRIDADPNGAFSPREAAATQYVFVKGTTSASLNKAKSIQTLLNKGEDFVKVAGERSDDKQNAILIFLQDKSADPNVLKAVSTLEINKVSDPVKTENGYFLFKVGERGTIKPTDGDKTAFAKDSLLDQRRQVAAEAFNKELEANRKSLVQIN